jgi:hypothetical protein
MLNPLYCNTALALAVYEDKLEIGLTIEELYNIFIFFGWGFLSLGDPEDSFRRD